MIGLLLAGVLVVWLVARVRRRRKRATSADALTSALQLVRPYKGPKWRVRDRWL